MTSTRIDAIIAEVTRMEGLVRDVQQQWNLVEQQQQSLLDLNTTLITLVEKLQSQNTFLFWLCLVQIVGLVIFALVRYA